MIPSDTEEIDITEGLITEAEADENDDEKDEISKETILLRYLSLIKYEDDAKQKRS